MSLLSLAAFAGLQTGVGQTIPNPVTSIATGRGRIGSIESGSGGIPIVFLHGVGSDKSVWAPQLVHFGRSRRAVAFDYPGYCDSDPAPEGASRDDYAKAILAAMDALAIDRAHVCGLSLGGVISIALHSLAADRCASLILADSFAVHPDGRGIYQRSLAGSANLRAMAEARVDFLLAAGALGDVRTEVVETMSKIDPAAYRIGAEAVWLADQRDRAAAIDLPTLVIVGEEDRATPPALSRELADLIPGARLETIAGAGHISNLERPAEFDRIVEDFITAAESAPS
jgi:3-oxoadipate enol-lactonase